MTTQTVIINDRTGTVLWAEQTDNHRVRPEPTTFLDVLDQHGIRAKQAAFPVKRSNRGSRSPRSSVPLAKAESGRARHCIEQQARVLVLRIVEQLLGRGCFHHIAPV